MKDRSMNTFMKSLLVQLLTFAFTFQPVLLRAQVNQAEFRYDHYLVDSFAFDYRGLNSKADFLKKFGTGLKPTDVKALEKSLVALGSLPKINWQGNRISFAADRQELTFDLSRIAKGIIVANGVQVIVDTKLPLAPQVEVLAEKIDRRSRSTSWMDLLLPKAYALPPVVLGALAFVGMAFASKIIDRYTTTALDLMDYNACWIMKDKMKIGDSSPVCKDYIKAQRELASQNPEVKAVAEALKDVEVDSVEISIETCAHQSSDQTYRSEARFIKEAKRVRVQVLLEGSKVKDFRVLEYESDQLVATYVLKDQVLDKIKLPTAAAAEKATSEKLEPIEIEIPAVGEVSDPVLAAKQKLHKGLFSKIGQRLGVCKAREENRKAKAVKAAEGAK